jgi:uncharacterized protein (TIGR02452 family)
MNKQQLSPIPDHLYDQGVQEGALCKDNWLFDAQQWLKWFHFYASQRDKSPLRSLRIVVQWHTLNTFRKGSYIAQSSGLTVTIDHSENIRSCLGSKYYDNTKAESTIKELTAYAKSMTNKATTKVAVMCGDCLEAALLKKQTYQRIAVLNMASARRPGGGYRQGSGAQEENLFRRTNLAFCLDDVDNFDRKRKWHYPLDEFGGIFTPEALVIRGTELKGYSFLDQVQKMDVISVAAYARPKLMGNRLDAKVAQNTKRKMRLMFAMAHEHKVNCLVLSAFGCGAYVNPPTHIAQLFKEVIQEFDGVLEEVVFAIYNDHNAKGEGNVKPFEQVFAMEASPIVYN